MDLLDQAIYFATEKHAGMTRKLSYSPYILHPLEVASIASTISNNQDLLAAAVLHDVVEDAGVSLNEIQEKFGPRVYELVKSETEDKRQDRPPEDTWQIRKQESLQELKQTTDRDIKILWLSDKLANLRSYARSYRAEGPALWEHFNQKDPAMQQWYYERIAEYTNQLEHTDAYQEYLQLLHEIFNHD